MTSIYFLLIYRDVLDLISSLALILKTNQYLTSGLKLKPLTLNEKNLLYTFYYELCNEKTKEKVQEIEVPIQQGEKKKNATTTTEGQTKKMLVISKTDPHGTKGRVGRIERSAIYACDLITKRSPAIHAMMTSDKKLKFQTYFQQLAKGKNVFFQVES